MGDIDKAADLAKDIGAIEIFICRFEIMIVVAKEADLHAMLTPIGFGRQIRLDIAAKTTLRIIGLGKDIAVVKTAKLILLQKPERPSMVAGPILWWSLIGGINRRCRRAYRQRSHRCSRHQCSPPSAHDYGSPESDCRKFRKASSPDWLNRKTARRCVSASKPAQGQNHWRPLSARSQPLS